MGKKVERTRAGSTLTESQFWSKIRSMLRNESRWWKPISIVRRKARRAYKGPNKRQRYEYQCNSCKNWFSDKQVTVDHIIPAGSLRCAADLPEFVERLFCEESGLQCLCSKCHDDKTKSERNGKHKILSKEDGVAVRNSSGRKRRKPPTVKRRRVSKRTPRTKK